MNKKNIGSFYTPKIIADFMIQYLSEKIKGKSLSILEPSAGDGVFVKTILDNKKFASRVKNITAVEREEEELRKVKAISKLKKLTSIHADFLDYQETIKKTFSLVIGNPPYVKKNHLNSIQVDKSEAIHSLFPELSKNKIKNIWTAFLLRSIKFLKKDGVLAFILPAELLQVKYAEELRDLLKQEFERIEIFTFKELLFSDCKGQDTLILFCEKKSKMKGVYFSNIDDINKLKEFDFTLTQNIHVQNSKWNHHLTSDEYELLFRLKEVVKSVNYYCTSKPGIVTAANDYFIVNKEVIEEYILDEYAKPIIQKGIFVNGSVELNEEDFNTLAKESKPSYLVDLNSESIHHQKLREYIEIGENKELDKRYKMSIRENWYKVPNIDVASEAFFFKRCNEYPKFIKNNAGVLVTDSAYKVTMRKGFQINDLIYTFYNSLTLSFAELDGRFYGGGVLELTPNEFKNLPVPYNNIGKNDFNLFVKFFKSKSSIKEICERNDTSILKSIDNNLDADTIKKIFNIREKLYLSRIKAY